MNFAMARVAGVLVAERLRSQLFRKSNKILCLSNIRYSDGIFIFVARNALATNDIELSVRATVI